MKVPSASIIIPAYNSESMIRMVLEAILCQTVLPMEVIVVDDGSTDRTGDLVCLFSEVKYIRQKNGGPAAARNRGAREAQGDILVFMDSDCRPQADWLERLLEGFTEKVIGAVAGSYGIQNPESLLARCVHQEICFRHRYLMPVYPHVFGSYNVGIRREVFFDVGGFDESYRNASGEDNDLSYKILEAGYKIYFQCSSKVDHRHPWRMGVYFREQFRHGYWRVRMYRRHPGMMKGDDYTFWKDIVEAPLALFFLVLLLAGIIYPFSFFWVGAVLSISTLTVIEIFYACKIGQSIDEVFLLVVMMFCRSFVRAMGFVLGVLSICNQKKFTVE